MFKLVRALALLPLLSACGAPEGASELGSLRQAIVRGEVSDSEDNSVVYVLAHEDNGASACTGALVAPNLVITALHCITYSNAGQFSCNPDGTISTNNPGDGRIGQLLPAANVDIFVGSPLSEERVAVGARLFGTGTSQICRNDLGLVLLDRSLEEPVVKLRLNTPVKKGEYVRVLGYGQTETSGTSGRYRRGGRRIVDVGADSDGAAASTDTAAPRTFVIDEGPCHGDSGGPALSEQTGALLGVYSLSPGITLASCMGVGVRNVFTRASSFSSLILDAFTAAGAEPELEAPEVGAEPKSDSSGCSLAALPARTTSGAGVALCVLLALVSWRRRSAA